MAGFGEKFGQSIKAALPFSGSPQSEAAMQVLPLGATKAASSKILKFLKQENPKRFMTVTEKGKPFAEQNFPTTIQVRVKLGGPNPQSFIDEVKGLNSGQALRRATDNWPSAESIQIIGVKRLK